MSNYQIITDATADLTSDLATKFAVDTIPMEINLDGAVFTYVPGGGNISVQTLYEKMRAGANTSTSQINPLVYSEYFEKYLQNGIDVLYICFSSGLSATIQTATMIANELQEKYPERKINIVDTLCASVGEGLLVYEAARQKAAGLDLDQLTAWLEENKLKLCHWFTVDDLMFLKRGGRIGALSAAIGTTLKIKPVLHVDNDGHLINVKKAHGRIKSLRGMAEEMKKTIIPEMGNDIFIGHGGCMEDAQQLSAMIAEDYPDMDISICDIGPVIGAHAGPGVLALFFWGTTR